MPDTALLDVDGTLVDSNYQHALAWYRAFRRHDLTLPLWRLHRSRIRRRAQTPTKKPRGTPSSGSSSRTGSAPR